jgi:hypothetical protein
MQESGPAIEIQKSENDSQKRITGRQALSVILSSHCQIWSFPLTHQRSSGAVARAKSDPLGLWGVAGFLLDAYFPLARRIAAWQDVLIGQKSQDLAMDRLPVVYRSDAIARGSCRQLPVRGSATPLPEEIVSSTDQFSAIHDDYPAHI